MCMICAGIPVAAAMGAKFSADQVHQPEEQRKPIGKYTGIITGMLLIASVLYHTLRWQDQ